MSNEDSSKPNEKELDIIAGYRKPNKKELKDMREKFKDDKDILRLA